MKTPFRARFRLAGGNQPIGPAKLSRLPARMTTVLVLCLGLVATAAPTTPARASDYNVTINTGTTLTAGGNFQGFGVQEDTNWMWLGSYTSGAPVVPDDYNTYVAPRLQAMKLPWVRKFIDITWYEASQGTYTWTNNAMTGLYTDLQALKNDGTNVLLTIWEIPTWMSNYTTGDGVSGNRVSYWPTTTAQDSEWAQAVTDLLKHLYGTDGSGYSFSNIKWVGGPNELGNSEQLSVSALDTPYSDLDSDLTTAGIRSNVTFFGPDMYFPGGDTAITAARQDSTLNPLLGLYDVHDYQNSQAPFDSDANAAISAASGSGKQVWLTEFGDSNGDAQNWNVTSQWAIEALNHGYAAASIWTLGDEWYCGGAPCLTAPPPTSDSGTLNGGEWGLWAYKDSNYAPRLSYYAYSNITAHTAANSKVYANSCGCANLGVAALNDQNGHDTILVMNWNSTAQSVSFSYSGSSPTETMYRYTISSSSNPSGNLESYDEALTMSSGSFSDTIPANSFAVYSSLNPNGTGGGSSCSSFSSPYYYIINRATGAYLHNTSDAYNGLSNVFYVVTSRYMGDWLKWKVVDAGNGYCYLYNKLYPSNRLHETGDLYPNQTQVYYVVSSQYTGSFINWKMTSVGSGYYTISSQQTPNNGLWETGDVYNGDSSVHYVVTTPLSWGGSNQQWQFVATS